MTEVTHLVERYDVVCAGYRAYCNMWFENIPQHTQYLYTPADMEDAKYYIEYITCEDCQLVYEVGTL